MEGKVAVARVCAYHSDISKESTCKSKYKSNLRAQG